MQIPVRRYARYGIVTLALVGVVSGLRAYTRHQAKRSLEEFPPVGRFVNLDNSRLHYVRAGSGRPMVLIHGLGGLVQDFTMTIFDDLAKEFDVVAFDRPGFGYSTTAEVSGSPMATHVAYIRSAVNELGLQKPVIVGHSYGGAVALRYALEHQNEISGLVLLAPVAYPVAKWPGWASQVLTVPGIGQLTAEIVLAPVGEVIAPQTVKRAFAPDAVPADYIESRICLTNRPSQLLASAGDLAKLNNDISTMKSKYASITIPVSIITGTEDKLIDYDKHAVRLAKTIPHADLTILLGSGHQVHYAYPAEVLAAIRETAQRAGH